MKHVLYTLVLLYSLTLIVPSSASALSSCAKTFQDLSNTDAQYIPAIGCLNQTYCVVQGTQDGYLNASTQVTRGEAIAFVTRYHIEVLKDDWKNVNVAALPQYFTDVPPSYGLYKEIEIARYKNFIFGSDGGNGTFFFAPGDNWTAGYQGPNRSDYNFSLVPADQQSRGGFLKSMYDKSPQYCTAPTLCNDQNPGTPPRPNGMCSNNYGCQKARPYYSSTPDCNTPIQQPNYDPDPTCGPISGGDNKACPVTPPTATPIPPTATQAPTPTTGATDGTTCSDITNANGYVKLAYTAPTSGTYTIWTRMKTGSAPTEGYILQVGNQCNVLVGGANGSTTQWQWINYRDGNTNSKVTAQLQAGKSYTIHLAGRENGVKVDKLLLSLDPNCVPTGLGDNCSAPVEKMTGTLSASPNPCTITSGSDRCTSTISWSTQNIPTGTVVQVRIDGDNALFAQPAPNSSGNGVVNWITPANPTFILFAGQTELSRLTVRGEAPVVPTASPTPTPAPVATNTPTPTLTPTPTPLSPPDISFLTPAEGDSITATSIQTIIKVVGNGDSVDSVTINNIPASLTTNSTQEYSSTISLPNTSCAETPFTISASVKMKAASDVTKKTVNIKVKNNCTPSPTPTPVPNATTINFAVILHAIGLGGDNTNPNGQGNFSILRDSRPITVEIYNTQNNSVVKTIVTTITKEMVPSSEPSLPPVFSGKFLTSVSIPSGEFQTGTYTIRAKVPTYLKGRIQDNQQITAGKVNNLDSVTLVVGDTDQDNKLSLLDYNRLIRCYSDIVVNNTCSQAEKEETDLNDDGKINFIDLQYFIRELAVQRGES